MKSTEEDYDYVFNTNTKGVFFTLREAATRVKDGGHIVVVSTGGTKMQFADFSLYLGSKGAIEQFARSLSRVKNRIAILSVSDNNWVTGRRARNRFAIGWVQPRSGVLSIATRLPLPA